MKTLLISILFATLMTVYAQAGECNVAAVADATTPATYTWTKGADSAREKLAQVPRTADVMLTGDSLLAYWPEDMTARQFSGQRVWNFSVGGSRTQHLLWLHRQLPDQAPAPRLIVVLIGTNNVNLPAPPACAVASGIQAVVTGLGRRWPRATIFVLAIPPKGSDFRYLDTVRVKVNRMVRDWVARQVNIRFVEIDPVGLTCGLYSRQGAVSKKDEAAPRSKCRNYADDYGHFRRAGYDFIFAALKPHLGLAFDPATAVTTP